MTILLTAEVKVLWLIPHEVWSPAERCGLADKNGSVKESKYNYKHLLLLSLINENLISHLSTCNNINPWPVITYCQSWPLLSPAGLSPPVYCTYLTRTVSIIEGLALERIQANTYSSKVKTKQLMRKICGTSAHHKNVAWQACRIDLPSG